MTTGSDNLQRPPERAASLCLGRGLDGEHCCQVNGADCEFLVQVFGVPRCGLWNESERLVDLEEWQEAPIGRAFAEQHPGFDCKDWPQGLPEYESWLEPDSTVGLCCFDSERRTC